MENCYFLLEGRIGCYKINPRLKSVVSSDLVEVIEKQDIIG